MAGIRYQISQNALRRVIDAGAKYVRWTGFVPVSPEFKQKIEDAEKITDAAIQQIDNLERRMEKIADRASLTAYVSRLMTSHSPNMFIHQ
jgi:hypothetical protein